jgi:hypothetical protein
MMAFDHGSLGQVEGFQLFEISYLLRNFPMEFVLRDAKTGGHGSILPICISNPLFIIVTRKFA